MNLTRRRFITATGSAMIASLGYMRFLEPRRLKNTKLIVNSKKLQKPIRLLHLSDLHASHCVPYSFIDKAIETGLSNEPDIICITGDMILKEIPEPEKYASILRKLSQTAPTFFCPGNHDGGSWAKLHGGLPDLTKMFKMLDNAGIDHLLNESRAIEIKGNKITVTGLGDFWSSQVNPRRAFEGVKDSPENMRLLLSHNPDSKEMLARYDWDLMLCGHTHGGQLYLPGIGTPFAPVEDHKYVSGLNEWKGRNIYTTCGIGNLFGMRFNCPPEVSTLDFIKA